LKPLQEIVGGFIEPVYLDTHDLIMWVNEEGRLLSHVDKEGKTVNGLPFNAIATALVADVYYPSPVVDMLGDVAFTGRKTTWSGNTLGLTERQIEFLMSYDKKANDSGDRELNIFVTVVE
jgi:hypothetical protein